MIAFRDDLARNLLAGFDNYSAEVATGYGAYLAPSLSDGEAPVDAGLQLVLLRRTVERQRQNILSLDEDVVGQTQEDDKVRAEIELRRDAVDGKLRLVRHACRGIYGSDTLGRIGIEGDFPRGAMRLYQLGQTVKSSLEKPDSGFKPLLDLDLGNGKDKRLSDQLAAQLDPELTELGDLVDERHNERRKSTDVRLQRQKVIREFDENIRGIVRLTQGMFRLAGRPDLAARFRPTLQRVLRKLKAKEASEETEAETDAQTEGAGAETAPTDDAAASEVTTA